MNILIDLWRQELQPWINALWESATAWRVLLLGIITLIVVALMFRTRLARWVLGLSTHEHDVAIFKAADAIADEQFLDGLLNRDVYQGRCELDDAIRLDHFTQYLARTENQYRDRVVRRVTTKLLAALAPVQRGVRAHFFPIGNSNVLKFYPDQIDEQHYRRSGEEMNAALDVAWPAFQRYRHVVKTRLTI
jgi:hypothetical protein